MADIDLKSAENSDSEAYISVEKNIADGSGARAPCRREFERCVKLFHNTVFTAAYCCVKNPYDADDITQEVFFKLYTCGKEFESDEHIKAWLIRCAVNRGRNLLHSHWYRFSEPLDAANELAVNDSHSYESELLRLLKSLKAKYSVVLYMYYYEGYSTVEIAKILHITENAASIRLRRGRQKLKKLLTDEGDEGQDALQGSIR